jgi:hypothetical protein
MHRPASSGRGHATARPILMPDRADYLANVLLKRREDREAALLGDAAPDRFERNQRRQEMVAKVLAVDAGATDQRRLPLQEASAHPANSKHRQF